MKRILPMALVIIMMVLFVGCSGKPSTEESPNAVLDNDTPTFGVDLPFDVAVTSLEKGHSVNSRAYGCPMNSAKNGTITISGTAEAIGDLDNPNRKIQIKLYKVNDDQLPYDTYEVSFKNHEEIKFEFTGLGTRAEYYIQILNISDVGDSPNLDVTCVLSVS